MRTANRGKISLKGSTIIIVEFFEFALTSIFFQRGVYPAEDFKWVKKYGLNVLVTIDDNVKLYLSRLSNQLETWLTAGKIDKLVLAIISCETRETLERWQFDIEVIEENKAQDSSTKKDKSYDEIQKEIQGIIRQITASVSFLPILEDKCTFTILAYTDKDIEVPAEWKDGDPHLIPNAEQVKLRSFSTMVHRVHAQVAYKLGDEV
ncbi:Mitotic spindle checkpoint component mad2 [Gigaspora margarita]|uniref:Mitotic spindle checkpoint component mad2 n=1 Tax=Gigaspora margarita TaxID=4874 RepID=A0A8H4ADH4_GIGMA|nr:Mitotic spindle checkpoint component mad2 [Gigaspora margarita]